MQVTSLPEQIENFWNWFNETRPLIEEVMEAQRHPAAEDIIKAFDQHILGMGTFKWEITVPTPTNYQLILSPNNKAELLSIGKKIVAEAPAHANWNFLPGKPASGATVIQVYDREMDVQEVDATHWQCSLALAEDQKYELTILAENTTQLDEDTELIAADLILTELLGEELKIETLIGFDVCNQIDEQEKATYFPLKKLLNALT